jgi:hypothetical protein
MRYQEEFYNLPANFYEDIYFRPDLNKRELSEAGLLDSLYCQVAGAQALDDFLSDLNEQELNYLLNYSAPVTELLTDDGKVRSVAGQWSLTLEKDGTPVNILPVSNTRNIVPNKKYDELSEMLDALHKVVLERMEQRQKKEAEYAKKLVRSLDLMEYRSLPQYPDADIKKLNETAIEVFGQKSFQEWRRWQSEILGLPVKHQLDFNGNMKGFNEMSTPNHIHKDNLIGLVIKHKLSIKHAAKDILDETGKLDVKEAIRRVLPMTAETSVENLDIMRDFLRLRNFEDLSFEIVVEYFNDMFFLPFLAARNVLFSLADVDNLEALEEKVGLHIAELYQDYANQPTQLQNVILNDVVNPIIGQENFKRFREWFFKRFIKNSHVLNLGELDVVYPSETDKVGYRPEKVYVRYNCRNFVVAITAMESLGEELFIFGTDGGNGLEEAFDFASELAYNWYDQITRERIINSYRAASEQEYQQAGKQENSELYGLVEMSGDLDWDEQGKYTGLKNFLSK